MLRRQNRHTWERHCVARDNTWVYDFDFCGRTDSVKLRMQEEALGWPFFERVEEEREFVLENGKLT